MKSNNTAESKKFIVPILSLVIISILTVATVITYVDISIFEKHMNKHIKNNTKRFLDEHKNIAYKKVHLVNDSIKFYITQIENKLKKSLKERIETSLDIAQYIYDKQKGKISNEEIKKRIAEHLGAIRFNEGRGYYYVIDNKTNIMLFNPVKKFNGKDLTNIKDSRGTNLIAEHKKVLKDNKIGIVKQYLYKPNEPDNEYLKMNYITIFEPLNIIIGTGEYLDVIEKQIKKFIINRFSNLQKDESTYLFIYDLHKINGGDNFATMILNPNRPDLIGKKLNENYKDVKGKMFRKEFLEDIREKGESYTKYWYKKPHIKNPKSKMSYFYLQKDWNWIIGSGFYFDDLEQQILLSSNDIIKHTKDTIYKNIMLVAIILFVVIIIALLVSLKIDKTIKKYTDKLIEYKDNEIKQSNLIMEQSKMAQMGDMIGNIAHQWRQPLSVISTGATGIQVQKEFGNLTDNFLDETCTMINKNAQYLSETIDTFSNFIKEEKELKEVVLQDIIENIITIIESSLTNKHIELKTNIEPKHIKITMVMGELSQVIINILNNAKDILEEKNIENPVIELNLIKEKDKAIITIEDNGGGIPPEVMPKIFDPYFTTKHQSQGTGLGLHMSYQIITNNLNGKIYAKNTENGAKLFIEIPL